MNGEARGNYGFVDGGGAPKKGRTWLLVLVSMLLAIPLVAVPAGIYLARSGDDKGAAGVVDESTTTTTKAVDPSTTTRVSTPKQPLGDATAAPSETSELPASQGDSFESVKGVVGDSFGGSDLSALIDALIPGILPLSLPVDAELTFLTVGTEVGHGASQGELNSRVFAKFRTGLSVDDLIDFYRSFAESAGLIPGETTIGSDDGGNFTMLRFGEFGSHPSIELEWAHIQLTVRALSEGSSAEFFFSQETLGDLRSGGLVAAVSNTVPLPDGYEVSGTDLSLSRFDLSSKVIEVNLSVHGVVERVVTDEDAEIAGYIAAYEGTGRWEMDNINGTQVRFETPDDEELSAYASLGYVGDSRSFVYNTFYFSTRLGYEG